ncbi:hypothetical protein ACQ4LE_006429 [Meloidogyne hapla]|uniref:ER membrane protein complex subunit 6 n=1 Tax=Meloidogyne hapla TaxID=6305 RepID=A0A1I8BD75_MELHA
MKSEKKATSSANKKHAHSTPTNQLQNSTEVQGSVLPATSTSSLTNKKSSRLQQQQQKQMFNEAAVRNNFYVLEQSRTCQSAVSGIASGILGLTGIIGFVFYFVCVLIQALIWDYKAGFQWTSFFTKRSLLVGHSLIGGLFTYVLFWVFVYGLVHVY